MEIKIPAFVGKYAAYKKKEIASNSYMPDTVKTEKTERINRAIHLVEYGFITIDECMKFIMEV